MPDGPTTPEPIGIRDTSVFAEAETKQTGKITYNEVTPGSIEGAFAPDASSMVRTYHVIGKPTMRQVHQFCWSLLGYPYMGEVSISGSPVTRLLRAQPEPIRFIGRYTGTGTGPDPYIPLQFLACSKILSYKGIGPRGKVDTPSQGARFQDAVSGDYYPGFEVFEVKALFESFRYKIGTWSDVSGLEYNRNVTKSSQGTANFLRALQGQYVWDSGTYAGEPPSGKKNTGAISSDIGVLEGEKLWEWTWYDVPAAAFSRTKLDAAKGSVNDATFGADTYWGLPGFPAETLLFLNYRDTPSQSIYGEQFYTIKFDFLEKLNISSVDGLAKGHNWKLNAQGYYQRVKRSNAGGTGIYPTYSFPNLFLP